MRALRMRTTADVEVARDGHEALDYLFNDAKSTPRLVLLDLKLPTIDGLEVLRHIRADERTCLTPVVILTSSDAPIDVAAGYRHGASSYVRKPLDFVQFSEAVHQLACDQRAAAKRPRPVAADPGFRGFISSLRTRSRWGLCKSSFRLPGRHRGHDCWQRRLGRARARPTRAAS